MRVRTRNRIIRGFYFCLFLVLFSALIWIEYQAFPRRAIVRLIIALVILLLIWIVTEIYMRKIEKTLKRAYDDAGISREGLPKHEEDPLPILPPLAKNWQELAGGIFFVILLIITILILSWIRCLRNGSRSSADNYAVLMALQAKDKAYR